MPNFMSNFAENGVQKVHTNLTVDRGRVKAAHVAALDQRLPLLQLIPHIWYCLWPFSRVIQSCRA